MPLKFKPRKEIEKKDNSSKINSDELFKFFESLPLQDKKILINYFRDIIKKNKNGKKVDN